MKRDAPIPSGSEPRRPRSEGAYRPQLRTALVLSGTGTAGAYHAGVLRALREAGIKIDLVAAHGVGAGAALLTAVDGAAGLWEPGGFWRDSRVRRLYRLTPALAAVRLALFLGAALVVLPLLVLAAGLVAYPLGFIVQLVSPEVGQDLIARYTDLVARAFEPAMLPTILPRLALFMFMLIVVIVAAAGLQERLARGDRRRDRGPWWSWVLGAPWNAREAADLFREALWKFLRGAAAVRQPPAPEFSRRYAELLTENLGQPGFTELMVVAHDLDARHDVVFALLSEPFRRKFHQEGAASHRRRAGDLVDLSGTGRQQVLDALAAALCLPVLSEAHPVTFPLEGFWQGETHRLSDRLGLVSRVLDEVAAAGVRQVLLVSAAADRALPHGLVSRSLTLRSRVAEYLASEEVTSIGDAVATRAGLFDAVFRIVPSHNPLAPMDFGGIRDERSDRTYPLTELIDRGYEDAYRQFIEPVVGASGERLGG
ncbi:MAG TPA: patatin-like phospholipase family protein [Vicinamibacterales bacterium]